MNQTSLDADKAVMEAVDLQATAVVTTGPTQSKRVSSDDTGVKEESPGVGLNDHVMDAVEESCEAPECMTPIAADDKALGKVTASVSEAEALEVEEESILVKYDSASLATVKISKPPDSAPKVEKDNAELTVMAEAIPACVAVGIEADDDSTTVKSLPDKPIFATADIPEDVQRAATYPSEEAVVRIVNETEAPTAETHRLSEPEMSIAGGFNFCT